MCFEFNNCSQLWEGDTEEEATGEDGEESDSIAEAKKKRAFDTLKYDANLTT